MPNMPTFQTDLSAFTDAWKLVPGKETFSRCEPSFLRSNREFTTEFRSVSTYLIACVFCSFKFFQNWRIWTQKLQKLSIGTTFKSVKWRCLFNFVTWEAIFSTRERYKGRRLIRRSQSKTVNRMPVNRSLLPCLHPKNVDISLHKMQKIKVVCLNFDIIKQRSQ